MAHFSEPSEADVDLIDQYLAGTLTGQDRIAFEARLRSESHLAQLLFEHQAISASLQRCIPQPAVGAVDLLLAKAHAEADRPAGRIDGRKRLRRLGAIAAIVGMGVAGTLLSVWSGAFSNEGDGNAANPYAQVIAADFRPSFEVTDADAVELLVAEKLNCTLMLPDSEEVKYLGVRSDVGGSPMSLGVLCLVSERRVLLVVDRAPGSGDPNGLVTTSSPQKGLFRHQYLSSSLSLVEWSESESPVIVNRVRTQP